MRLDRRAVGEVGLLFLMGGGGVLVRLLDFLEIRAGIMFPYWSHGGITARDELQLLWGEVNVFCLYLQHPSHFSLQVPEHSLFELAHDLEQSYPELPRRMLVVDAQQREQLAHVFGTLAPQVIFHAASHKHVPLMEVSPAAAVLNNVLGTRTLVELSLEHRVERFVSVSTDKVVNPTSVMGVSKRVAECIVQQAAQLVCADYASDDLRHYLWADGRSRDCPERTLPTHPAALSCGCVSAGAGIEPPWDLVGSRRQYRPTSAR